MSTINKVYSSSIPEVIKPSTGSLSSTEVRNSIISNYGQTEANTQTLPAAVAGLSGTVLIGKAGAGAFTLLPASASDIVYLDGTALTAGHGVTFATPLVGNTFDFFTFKTGSSSYAWSVQSKRGTLTSS